MAPTRTRSLKLRTFALIAVTASALCSSGAYAHPLDLGYLRIVQSGTEVAVTLDVDVKAAGILLNATQPSAPPPDAAAVTAHASELASASYALEPIRTDGGVCVWSTATAQLLGNTVTVRSTATCPPGQCRWMFPFVRDHRVSPVFTLMVKQSSGASEQLTLVEPTRFSIELAAPSAVREVGFTHFVALGIEHIGAAPNQWRSADRGWHVPDGIDHILFLLGLMLGGGTLLQMAKVATGFTVGHSITLAIAALGIARPPSSVVEPLIALSIAFVAVESFMGKYARHRWKIAAAFGLIHGFGFASALTALDLSTRGLVTALLGFNVGVELGQMVIVVALAPLILLAHRRSHLGRYFLKALAVMIFVLGIYWFFQRLNL